MGYLITQIIVCLLIAALIGFILGWLLRGLSARSRETYLEEECEDRIGKLKAEWSSAKESDSGVEASTVNTLAATSVAGIGSTQVDDDATVVREIERDRTGLESLSYPIDKIEGIGKGLGNRLRNIKIKTTSDLIDKSSTATEVQQIVNATKVEESVVRDWVSMADLMRIPDLNGQYAELLKISGIQSVLDLANEDAQTLASKMELMNQREHRVPDAKKLPGAREVARWIESARILSTQL